MFNNLIATVSSICVLSNLSAQLHENMTLEEKVGQVLMVHFHGEIANEEARTLIHDVKIGGIIYYQWSNGLTSPEQVQNLSFGLQAIAKTNRQAIPLFIAVDQEGGMVSRLNHGFTTFPGNKALGQTNQPSLAEEAALYIGEELQAVGINMNFAPVVDVNNNPRNPVIGIRSFGDDPKIVSSFGKKALAGYKQAHVIACLKHFPGHGDVEDDSHEKLPVVHHSLKELEEVELLPFAELANSTDLIMTAHLLVPALDKKNCSTLSKPTLSYLKDTLGFKGVIITDSLVMAGVLKKCHSIDEVAIQAFNAGSDILLLGGKQLIDANTNFELSLSDIQRIHRSLINAVKNGRIAEERLNEAVCKILNLKEKYLNFEDSQILPNLAHFVNTPQHQALAQKISSSALKIFSNFLIPIDSLHQKNIVVFSPKPLQETIKNTTLHEIGKIKEEWYYNNFSPSLEEIEEAKKRAAEGGVLLIFSYNAWKNPNQKLLIQSLIDLGKPVILVVVRDPVDQSLFPQANLIINTFSPTIPSIQAACNYLKEHVQ